MIKKILPIVLGLAFIGGAVAFYFYNKPVASLEHKKPDVVITAPDILTAYETDEDAANADYLGKVVQVSGAVTMVTDEGGKIKVYLDTGSPMSAVICELADPEMPDLDPGEQVAVKGLCSGYLSDVILVQSHLSKP